MWTKKKLSKEILVLLAVSMVISIFLFAFLDHTTYSIAYRYLEHAGKLGSIYAENVLGIWVQGVCLLASAIFFVGLFLFLLGQKLAYLQEIITGTEALRTHRMDYRIPVEGDNELTELARSINFLSQTEQELLRKEAALTAEREQFIRSIAHDIRTPLTSVLSYAELLAAREQRTESAVDGLVDLTLRKGQQMKDLMEQLLQNQVRHADYFEDGQLLLRQVVDDWESVLGEDFTVQVDWSDCTAFSGYFDMQEVFRVFDNLLSNIKKYADAKSPVLLRLRVEQGILLLEQSNAVARDCPETESHRLGLATIRHIISRYGGSVQWECGEERFQISIRIPVNV